MEPKVIKLQNGELLIAVIKQSMNDVMEIENPIAVVPIQTTQGDMVGETFLLKPWIGISGDANYFISKKNILTVCSIKDNLEKQYRNYVSPPPRPDIQDEPFDVEGMIEALMLKSKNLLN